MRIGKKYKFTKSNENIITKKCIEIWKQAVLENKNVIVSDTNLKQNIIMNGDKEQLMLVILMKKNIFQLH